MKSHVREEIARRKAGFFGGIISKGPSLREPTNEDLRQIVACRYLIFIEDLTFLWVPL